MIVKVFAHAPAQQFIIINSETSLDGAQVQNNVLRLAAHFLVEKDIQKIKEND